MHGLAHTVSLVVTNILLVLGILVFAKGFFPYKAVLPGLATWREDSGQDVGAPFNKVVFMVVDALRSDFLYSNTSNFHFTQQRIRDGSAVPFTGHASPPTVTMPRVKAITTGGIPSFLDLVLNFAESDTSSTLATQDSWLAQLKSQSNGKLVMYGDDTWLRLFPGFFERADGTTSFFVSDFTEVDNNVTRHVPEELLRDDWNGLILHYLGLDHIGHKTGPRGPNMLTKQLEMDSVVKQIYTAIQEQAYLKDCLLVLLGDHGMNDAGNHGANSAGEVSTALTFLSPKFADKFSGWASPAVFQEDFSYYTRVDQSDVAPTLAALLGFPVPRNSLGKIITPLLDMFNDEQRVELLVENAAQIQAVAQATYPDEFAHFDAQKVCMSHEDLTDIDALQCAWHQMLLLTRTGADASQIEQQANLFLTKAQRQLSGAASKYDLIAMQVGLTAAGVAVVAALFLAFSSTLNDAPTGLVSVLLMVLYSITMFASSYVEEEHQFWYWLTGAWLLMLTLRYGRNRNFSGLPPLVLCTLFFLTRRWNQTGQKYAGEAAISTQLADTSQMIWLLWMLVVLTYVVAFTRTLVSLANAKAEKLSAVLAPTVAFALLFKITFTVADAPELVTVLPFSETVVELTQKWPLVTLAQMTFGGLLLIAVVVAYMTYRYRDQNRILQYFQCLHNLLSIFLITQTRTTNIPLYLFFYGMLDTILLLGPLLNYPGDVTTTSLLMQYTSFFAFGGTNAISTVDLSNAYNGVSGFNSVAVGILTFVSNWTGPIWWSSATAFVLLPKAEQQPHFSYFSVLTLFSSMSALAVMVACTTLREHLFIWTVFSPKYLYMMAWTFVQHLVVNGLFTGIISLSGVGKSKLQ